MAHTTKNHDASVRWVQMYPVYIDSNKSKSEGRRLPKEQCVATPTLRECLHALDSLGFEFLVDERKMYSRDFLLRGRFRVHLRKSDGSPRNPKIPDRTTLFEQVAERIREVPNRVVAAAATATSSSSSSSTPAAPASSSTAAAANLPPGASISAKKGKKKGRR